jgi:DNA-binding NarL/FixJ family response regulator
MGTKESKADSPLTPRQQEICVLLLQGEEKEFIVEVLHIKMNTLNTHLKTIYHDMGVHSRFQCTRLLREHPEWLT